MWPFKAMTPEQTVRYRLVKLAGDLRQAQQGFDFDGEVEVLFRIDEQLDLLNEIRRGTKV